MCRLLSLLVDSAPLIMKKYFLAASVASVLSKALALQSSVAGMHANTLSHAHKHATCIHEYVRMFNAQCSQIHNIYTHKARCQVFMSQEVSINSFITFSIAVLYCPYDREPVPDRYKYELAESGLLDLKVSDNKLHFQVNSLNC